MRYMAKAFQSGAFQNSALHTGGRLVLYLVESFRRTATKHFRKLALFRLPLLNGGCLAGYVDSDFDYFASIVAVWKGVCALVGN